jgi:hypothetical protein
LDLYLSDLDFTYPVERAFLIWVPIPGRFKNTERRGIIAAPFVLNSKRYA